MCRFSDAGNDNLTTRSGGRRPKSAKARNRGGGWVGRWCGRYGDLATGREFATAIRLDRGHNLNVTARILLNGDFTFCPISDFNELSLGKKSRIDNFYVISFTTSFGRPHRAN